MNSFENSAAKINRDRRAKNVRIGVAKQQETLHRRGRKFRFGEDCICWTSGHYSRRIAMSSYIYFRITSVSVEKHSSSSSKGSWEADVGVSSGAGRGRASATTFVEPGVCRMSAVNSAI